MAVGLEPGVIFKTLHFHLNLQMGEVGLCYRLERFACDKNLAFWAH
jgi:hypothetical protein